MDLWRLLNLPDDVEGTAFNSQVGGSSQTTDQLGDIRGINTNGPVSNPAEDSIVLDDASDNHQSLPEPDSTNDHSERASDLTDRLYDQIASPVVMQSATPMIRTTKQFVISKIEDQFAAIAGGLQRREEVSILIRTRRSAARSSQAVSKHEEAETLVRFPGRMGQEAWRFGKQISISGAQHC